MGRSRTRRNQFTIEQARKDAQERQAARDARSPQEQLTHLDQLLGEGVGAKRERSRLQKTIDAK